MKIYWDSEDLKREKHIVAIGNFDGLHPGHLRLLERVRELKEEGEKLGIITFFPHPETVIRSRTDNFLLTTYDEKIKLMEKHGVDSIFFIKFTSLFSETTPSNFIERILSITDIRHVVVGKNFKFGKNGRGNPEYLKKNLEKRGIKLDIMDLKTVDGEVISSTIIRNSIMDCKFQEAEKFLGRKYLICGTVMHGKNLGRKLGFPTANLEIDNKIIPRQGVFRGEAYVRSKKYFSLIFIGKPTFSESGERVIEAWIENFHEDIYGEEVCIRLEKFMRNVKKVPSEEKLKKLIKSDLKRAKDEMGNS